MQVESNNYKTTDQENVLKKYGVDLKGSKITINPTSKNYSNIKNFGEIDVWINDSLIESISFYPEGFSKMNNFLLNKSEEYSSKSEKNNTISNKKNEVEDFVINKQPILCTENGECYLQRSVKEMTDDELRIARNEIYARHGYIFKDYRYKRYFENQYWYNPVNNDSVEVDKTLTKNEKICIGLILDEEQKRGLTENFN